MTVYTIADLERLAAGQGTRNVPSHIQIRNVPSTDFRVDIRRDIYNAVLKLGRATRADIAKATGRKKSTWLNDRIETLVADGLLCREHTFWKNGVVMYMYEVTR